MSTQSLTKATEGNPFMRHRLGGWMPHDPLQYRDWLKKTIAHVRKHHHQTYADLHPSTKHLWDLIESQPDVRMLFVLMLEQVPNHEPYLTNPALGPEFRDWADLLFAFDYQLTQGPIWLYNTAGQQGLVGFPFNAFLDWPMGTPAGIAAFIRPDVNDCLREMLAEYGTFLMSPASSAVLNNLTEGWLSTSALSAMSAVADPEAQAPFASLFECDPEASNYGYASWDAFFTRKFQPGVRPVSDPEDDAVIVNACESGPLDIAREVKLRDDFWVKGQPYSLADMLGGEERAKPFVGGTVYQAFLSALSYHCWHAPVSGVVKEIVPMAGTYYAENYWEGFANVVDGQPDPDPSAPNNSQKYICQVAARSLLLIEAENPAIGVMGLLMVGMAEVSSCDWFVQEGQHIKKGELIGTFHFGGSSHCLIFGPDVKLEFVTAATNPPAHEQNLPVCSKLATVQ